MQKAGAKRKLRKPQQQQRPGYELEMEPAPVFDHPDIKGSGKLKNKFAVITGGDSGIGKAVAVLFAREGADVAIIYLNENDDASETKRIVEEVYQRTCLTIATDLRKEKNCIAAVKKIVKEFGRIDILVNNAGMHYEKDEIADINTDQLVETFTLNIFAMFWITKEAIASMARGSSIINTASVTAYRGSPALIDYAATKGAIVSFTRSLSANLVKKGIRVNGVAPGPIWTPLIVSSFPPAKNAEFGSDVPMGRAGQPAEVAPSYLFFASQDASYITGQFLHPNGGEIING